MAGKEQSHFVAAIDFGTSNCSLAYTVGGKIFNLHISENFTRVPTALLLEKQSPTDSTAELKDAEVVVNVKNIGLSAQERHRSLPKSKYSSHLYFECFKMNLRHEPNVSRGMKITAFLQDKSYYLLDVISLILQHLRIKFEEYLRKSAYKVNDEAGVRKLKATDFSWTVTVPAIWQEKGKQIMREAVYKAGLLCDVTPITTLTPATQPLPEPVDMRHYANKLILALEPECASLYCHLVTKDMRIANYPGEKITSDHYMIVDVGGGTVDIAIHDFNSKTNTLHSVLPPTGNDWGGTKVNVEFSKVLEKIVGDPEFKRFSTAEQKVIMNSMIYKSFEESKKIYGALKASEINIRLDSKLFSVYDETEIMSGLKSLNDDRVEIDDDVLIFNSSKTEELFAPAVQGIINCVVSALKKSPISIDTVYLVGEFGGCQYIYSKINDELSMKYPKIKIEVPPEHNVAISRGAVIFQQNPNIIYSRVSSAYYGIEISENWDPEKHSDSRAQHNEKVKQVQCLYIFDTIIHKGQVVKFDDTYEESYEPNDYKSDHVFLDIYRTYKDGIKYTRDEENIPIPEVDKIGTLELETPLHDQDHSQCQRTIKVTFYVGRSELQVRAVYVATGKNVATNLDFLS